MYCNKIIQDELDEVMCPFCYKQIKERSVVVEKCWEKLSLESKDYAIVCTNCGQVDSYEPMKESLKAYLHGTTLSHATSLRQAYDMT